MRTPHLPGGLAPWLVVLALSGCAANRTSGDERADAVSSHKQVVSDDGASCQSCHRESHPEIVAAWSAGAHGLNLVECFVCHGAREAHFIKAPGAQRCDGCHTQYVASVTAPSGETTACFTCHDPHRLETEGKTNPHVIAAMGVQP